jgi:carbon monoxide dehydrogenase subunit G
VELEHRFELPVGVDQAFATLVDIAQVGPCFPGASVTTVRGEEFEGSVKLKVGPMRLHYRGTGRVRDVDAAAHTATIEATGSAGGPTNAAMLVQATASALAPNRTAVDLVTTLSLTGRQADFGRGVMVEVGNRLLSQFADCVAKQLTGKEAGGAQLVEVVDPDEVAAEVVADEQASLRHADPGGHADEHGGAPGDRPVASLAAPVGARPALDDTPTAATRVLQKVIPILSALVGAFLISRLFRRGRKDEDSSTPTG